MTARLYRAIVPVSDMDRAAEFYGAIFATSGERVSVDRHYFDCGGVILACVDPHYDSNGEAFRANPDHLYFAVDDLDAMFERAKGADCSWLEPAIASRAWGERSFYARDPFGNPICFVNDSTLFTGGRFVSTHEGGRGSRGIR